MDTLFAVLGHIDWGTVSAVVGLVCLLVSALQQLINHWRALTPADRRDWLQAALHAALQLQASGVQTPVDASASLAADINAFLRLHNVPVTVDPKQVELLLADAKVLLTGAATAR